jgi:hypothetical protein
VDTPTPVPTPTTLPAALSLEVSSPRDNSIVRSAEIPVTGQTSPDATVSVNGQLADVDSSGSFEALLALEEGPNLIEVIATDLAGDVRSQVWTVIYIP